MTERKPPRIGLGGFAEFASAMSSGRITAVQNVITNEFGGYDPGHDFYRQFRVALSEGIANGDDVLRVRRAIDDCTMPSKKTHYEELGVGWVRWRAKKKLEVFSQPRIWQSEGLEVKVSPQFTWQHRNEHFLVWPYLKGPELSRDGIQAAIRLMEMTHSDSGRRPAVLDVRRGKLHVATKRRRKGFDGWLTSEAAAFISLLGAIRTVA